MSLDWRSDPREKADPSISVSDLEQCINAYCDEVGYRDLQELVDVIKAKLEDKSKSKVFSGLSRLVKRKDDLPLGLP